MATDATTRGARYLARFTATDRQAVASALACTPGDLAAAPHRVEQALADPGLWEVVLPDDVAGPAGGDPAGERATGLLVVGVSPLLVFATAVHRCWQQLGPGTAVQEWTGPRERVPVFSADELRSFLDDGDRRLFLVELLAGFTRRTGGTVVVARGDRLRRHRFSDLDLASLARLLDLVDEGARADVYRRLGDASLFLTGVFPDHTATRRFAPIQVDRLARSLHATSGLDRSALAEHLAARGAVGLLEHLGQAWYRRAVDEADDRRRDLDGVAAIGAQFSRARRVLNHLADGWLFPFRATWLPTPN